MNAHGSYLDSLGIKQYNGLQEAVFAAGMLHSNLLVLAPTGSGKTISYLVPLAASLEKDDRRVQAVVIAPVRELAVQIAKVFQNLRSGHKMVVCYGGHSESSEVDSLRETPAVIVGTPGRLASHIRNGYLDVSTAHTLVVDEFDKALEMGFEAELSEIVAPMNGLQRRLLVSATNMGSLPEWMGSDGFFTVSATAGSAVEDGRLAVYKAFCPESDKRNCLPGLIPPVGPAIVFCNFREEVERVADTLTEQNIACIGYHGAMEQDKREEVMFLFASGCVQVLVATDIASRGFDIKGVERIIHYQLPQTEEVYTHRNGRTARMHNSGDAVILLSSKEYLPHFTSQEMPELPRRQLNVTRPAPAWEALFVSAGKKDKVNKVDIVGFLIHAGRLAKEEIGMIDVKDRHSFVAVVRGKGKSLAAALRDQKIKNVKVRIYPTGKSQYR